MNVLVVGANGKIGKQLVKKIQETEGLTAKAMIRKAEQVSYFEDMGAKTIIVDLEDDVNTITKAFDDVDAVVFTAGSGPSTGPDKTMLIDLDGAVKTIEAAKQANVKRFVMVSSFDTTRQAIQEAPASFSPYVAAKHYADIWLRDSGLNYTIVHPGMLTNDEGTGQVQIAEKVEPNKVPREDVAEVLLQTVQTDATIGKAFQVISGNTSIKEAIDSIK
ncbi:SDR family oxidoreductase [Paraliobacillus ryukyuensis]|uniref:SDR family oxidoreductase n=1 Tax=Paraliobacillus ryukyuensis TaxID=200904 RepID=UPI0009A8B876|nr:SDR family oxidoreductase [Paraliobacillus ryukyuensis]